MEEKYTELARSGACFLGQGQDLGSEYSLEVLMGFMNDWAASNEIELTDDGNL